MKHKGFHDVFDWYDDLWRTNKKHDFTDELRVLLLNETDEDRILGLRLALSSELTRHERFPEVIEAIEQHILADPKNSLTRVSLAGGYLYYLEDPKTALQKIDEAIPFARASGEFIRNAFQVKARILRKLEDYKGLAECMKEIMKIETVHPQLDAAKESDFLRNLPERAIPQSVMDEYAAFLSESRPKARNKT
jgi:tetratricopeptide (TPR) repeat protein